MKKKTELYFLCSKVDSCHETNALNRDKNKIIKQNKIKQNYFIFNFFIFGAGKMLMSAIFGSQTLCLTRDLGLWSEAVNILPVVDSSLTDLSLEK